MSDFSGFSSFDNQGQSDKADKNESTPAQQGVTHAQPSEHHQQSEPGHQDLGHAQPAEHVPQSELEQQAEPTEGNQGWAISNALAAALNTVGLGGVVPGQSGHDGTTEPDSYQSVTTNGQGSDGLNPESDSHQSVATAGQGSGESADGRSKAQASNFTNEQQDAARGERSDGAPWTSSHRQSVQSEQYQSSTHNNGATSHQTHNAAGHSGTGTGPVRDQSADPQVNAEDAAGRAFRRVSQQLGPQEGMQGSADGASENVTKLATDPAPGVQEASAHLFKPSTDTVAHGESGPGAQHAGSEVTTAVRENV